MAGYNDVLNPPRDYKEGVIQALVTGKEFPDFTPDLTKGSAPDMLAELFLHRDFTDIDHVMNLQYERFGALDEDLFWSAIGYIGRHEYQTSNDDFTKLMKASRLHPFEIPGEHIFAAWKVANERYFKDAIEYCKSIIAPGVTEYTFESLQDVFTKVLDFSGLSEKGWQAGLYERTNFISIAKSKKKILIGHVTVSLSQSRLIGLILHEVYIHSLWSEHVVDRNTDYEEGIGTLIEQLMLREFHPLRMYRFLAICLAVGLDGQKRTMREVYELLCEIRRVLRPDDSEEKARLFVAKEVVRVYRNLPPTVPGLVYIRDKNYMENNSKIWSTLSKEGLGAAQFISLVAPWEEKS